MLQMALRQAVELGSFVRAARNFSTGVPISDSSLQRLVVETGTTVVQADAQEAEAMVRVAKEEEGVTYRRIPEPDSEVMALCRWGDGPSARGGLERGQSGERLGCACH